jgi:hypothetical protein
MPRRLTKRFAKGKGFFSDLPGLVWRGVTSNEGRHAVGNSLKRGYHAIKESDGDPFHAIKNWTESEIDHAKGRDHEGDGRKKKGRGPAVYRGASKKSCVKGKKRQGGKGPGTAATTVGERGTYWHGGPVPYSVGNTQGF